MRVYIGKSDKINLHGIVYRVVSYNKEQDLYALQPVDAQGNKEGSLAYRNGEYINWAFKSGLDVTLEVEYTEDMTRFAKIRALTGLSRAEFGRRFAIPIRTLESWEYGTAKPPIYVLNILEMLVNNIVIKERNEVKEVKGGSYFGFV